MAKISEEIFLDYQRSKISNIDLDRFEESVVLLRNALCWTYKDVAYLKLNAREGSRDGQDLGRIDKDHLCMIKITT